ncbi:O-methyltransferase [Streptomyces millisiae]|uniref:O-methyltransferase n=1 Tax=Streptomyces millisiae TaxID=3075542 RepID=A0ABU2LYK8_9ACTN|nr:O-methyltransferase [Streptomyces sp. DSM 44918]MDT0322682.1 O-methyltransferase [Streptomyces sp. DSM 44918]
MTQPLWSQVDDYFNDLLIPADPALDGALAASEAAGLPHISVAPNQGKFLHLLARIHGARRILEIGTLGGYSTIWLARALLADGRLVTLEADPHHADVARANLERAGLTDRVDLRVGPALDSLPELAPLAPFDLVFVDADKPNNPNYLDWAIRYTRPGSIIVFDNVVRAGRVLEADNPDPTIQATRRLTELVAAHPHLTATTLQTVGAKGHDGITLALVTGP